MATVLVPMPGFPNAQLTGGVVRLRCRDVSLTCLTPTRDGAAIVHVFDAGGRRALVVRRGAAARRRHALDGR